VGGGDPLLEKKWRGGRGITPLPPLPLPGGAGPGKNDDRDPFKKSFESPAPTYYANF